QPSTRCSPATVFVLPFMASLLALSVPLLIVTCVLMLRALLTPSVRVPPLMVVAPDQPLTLPSVKLPLPCLVTAPPLPLITPSNSVVRALPGVNVLAPSSTFCMGGGEPVTLDASEPNVWLLTWKSSVVLPDITTALVPLEKRSTPPILNVPPPASVIVELP